MPTLNATAGDPNANSYATVEEADTYHDTLVNADAATWSNASADDKARALIMATRILDQQIEWLGYVSSNTQALQWPRTYMDTDKRMLLWPPGAQPFDWWNAYYVDPTTVPQRLKDATSEFARQLLAANRTADDELSQKGITRISAGTVEVSFTGYARPDVIPDAVFYMVRPWGRIRHRSESFVPLRRS